ncbi:YlbL family protein [Ornithinicoccus halotolerans]|uniref:YlbL family protein n=1 Tax=Ornithinicoccus halotolerans TaxID=1748220 RepID=UPI001294A224|nr:PDZ domain-containing protein [Ornithinicoccus halotolerans]
MSSPSDGSGYYRGFPSPARRRRPAHTAITGRTAAALVTVVVIVTAIALANLVTVAKVVYRPGPVYSTLGEMDGHPVVSIEGTETYPTSGALDFTTVVLHGGPRSEVTAWDWLLAEVDPRAEVVPEEQVYPQDVTAEQVREQNAELMAHSQQGAAVVALRAAGEEVSESIVVAQVIEDAPAAGVLHVDDVITEVAGEPVAAPTDVSDALQAYEPGEQVEMTVVRDGEPTSLQVPTGEGSGQTEGRTVVGVYLASDYELPYEITIDAGNVGGPSAGLMFSLAVYDLITPGQLTGGKEFAGTGTMARAETGEVGGISGIRQKMIGARDAGAEYFLAPADNCEQVRGHEPDGLEVLRVESFEQARDVVEAVGAGEDVELPRC